MSTGFVALNIFLLIALSVVFLAPAIRKMIQKKLTVKELLLRPKLEYGMLYVYLFTVICILVSSNSNGFDEGRDPDEVLEYAKKEELYEHQYWAYNQKIKKYKYDFKSIYYFAVANKKSGETKSKFFEWADAFNKIHIMSNYEYYELTKSDVAMERELGYFGCAATKLVHYKDPTEALRTLDSLKIIRKPFVNCLYGLCQNDLESKLKYFRKEIEYNGDVESAVKFYAKACYNNSDYSDFEYLYKNPVLLSYVPVYVKQEYSFSNGYLLDFMKFEIERIFKGTRPFVIFSALLILFLWLFFLNSIDPFEREKTKRVVFTFGVSTIFFFLSAYLYMAVHHFFELHLNGDLTNDFLYSTFIIGGIEELVKILPFLIVLKFTKGVTEPVDYLFYAGLSALTFSVLEDVLYFNTHTVAVIYSRAIFTCLGHIGCTSFIAYAMVLARYYYKKHKLLLFIGGFLVACLCHGVYDFFILNETASVWLIPYVILLLQSWWFVHIVNNCLNNSTHFDPQIKMKTRNIAIVVCGGLFLLIVIVYIHTALTMSADYATGNFFVALIWYFYPIFFLNICINRIDVFKDEWNTFSLRRFVDPKVFFAGIHHRYNEVAGKRISLSAYGKQTTRLLPFLPLTLQVEERLKIGSYKGWFVMESAYPVIIGGKYFNTIYMRTKEDNVPLEEGQRNLVAIYGLKDPELKKKEALAAKDLVFLDWAFLHFVRENKE